MLSQYLLQAAVCYSDERGKSGYSCLRSSCPSAGCTARVVHELFRKFRKCRGVKDDDYQSETATGYSK